ncbi:natterin-2-like [Momordica charantia]|uniref:Natterin-2-like n=1 Tax=Momordica charantia TaxID=3673 RepID=A0A6J1D9A4_MOMCH|nr:natterin-2-like [Momordica charantia]
MVLLKGNASLVSIPKYVAFKGHNGCYLSSRWIEGHQYHQFSSSDIGDSRVRMETFITKDGNIRIKSNYFGKFWRRSPNWIWADSTDTTTDDPDTLFCPTKIDNHVIALRNLGNKNFIKRFTYEYKTSCLNAATDSIDAYSRLHMEEPILEREIYDINFHPADSRIYDQTVLVMATGNGTNRTEVPNTMNLNLSYIETESSTWSSSISIKLGVKTSIETGIPRIVDGKVEVSSEFTGSYQWGKTITKTQTIGSTYQITVPPKTTVIVSLLATTGKCDVPYSYSQRDTLINGEIKYYEMDDGVYHGVNSYNFTYETKSKPAS